VEKVRKALANVKVEHQVLTEEQRKKLAMYLKE
jgi:hypothetical protein